MTSPFTFRQVRPDEAAGAARRAQIAFGGTDDFDAVVERIGARIADGLLWGLADRTTDQLLGQALLSADEHWFGGRRVRCQHIGGVGVAPEHRGAGVASALMREAVRHGAREGPGLSLLFPATTALYRRLGWEHAGTFTRWRVDARGVPALGPALRPLEDEWSAVEACQARWAAGLAGPEVRGPRRWERVRDAATYAYGLDAPEGRGLDAYVLVAHVSQPDDWRYGLDMVDWAALTPRALQAVVGFVGRHGTMGRTVRFRAPTPNPWSLLLPEQDLARDSDFDWMARPLDLAAAVTARGFPEGLTTSVTFAIDDAVLGARRWRLEVADGRGILEPAETAQVRMDVSAAGPLYTGYRSAHALALAGRLAGPEDALRRLDAAFAGPVPTLLDFF